MPERLTGIFGGRKLDLKAMNETKRKAYLHAMGIGFDCPTGLQSGKDKFPLLGDSEVASTPSFGLNRNNELPSLRKSLDEVSSSLESKFVDSVNGSENKAPEVRPIDLTKQLSGASKSESHSRESSLRFSLNFYWVNQSLAIIDEFPVQQSKSAERQSLGLLRNIISALDINAQDYEINEERLSWPITDGLTLLNDEASAARMMLFGFIESKLEQNSFQNLVVFAGILDHLLALPDEKENNRDFLYGEGDKKIHITITQSLQSMISFPALKRDVWNELQPLRKRI
ncbi:MAG: hypothetical protein P8K27_05450 [Gammaproteobacteria bacterium]|nr:hypothetical protein [Gammaproteobacteria bacterium]